MGSKLLQLGGRADPLRMIMELSASQNWEVLGVIQSNAQFVLLEMTGVSGWEEKAARDTQED